MRKMRLNRYTLLDFFEDAIGRILIVVGVLFIGAGLLYASPRGSNAFALGLFLGVLFIVVGFGVHLELFNVKILSRNGLGTLLIVLSPLLIVTGFIFVSFTEPDLSQAYLMPKMVHWRIIQNEWIVIVPLARIHAWLAMPMLIAGAASFLVGVLLKIFDNVF